MTEKYIVGDIIFIGNRLALVLNQEGDDELHISEEGRVFTVDPDQVHRPETLDERLLILFYMADAWGLSGSELHTQIQLLINKYENTESDVKIILKPYINGVCPEVIEYSESFGPAISLISEDKDILAYLVFDRDYKEFLSALEGKRLKISIEVDEDDSKTG